jgi:heavy metal translocating P-type ATPase
VDGALAADVAVLDESALTGEALPVQRSRGDTLRSGTVNAAGPFDLRATTSAADSTYAGIVRLVSEAESAQAPFVRLADRYALWFLPLSLAVAGVAGALGGAARAVAVLVVATPCPLILAAPVALVSGLSAAARRGIVVKNGGVLERLARCTTVLLDKTGTLTAGQPAVTAIVPAGALAPEEILRLAASLDQASGHVLATAVVRAAAERGCTLGQPADVTEQPGQGIAGTVTGRRVRLGRADWAGVSGTPPWVRAVRRRAWLDGALTVFVAVDGTPVGALLLEDRIRPDARQTIRALRRGGITRVVLATGDRAEAASAVGALTGVDEVLAELTPEAKLDAVRREQRHAAVIMTGDGINDAPALAQADVGVAMNTGTSAAKEAGNMVDLDSNPTKLIEIVEIGKQMLITRGSLTTFSIANDVSKYFAIIPAAFASTYPALGRLNVMRLASPSSAILSAVIFNALIIVALIPLALRGVSYKPVEASRLLRNNLLVYGVGGLIVPFFGIKLVDLIVHNLLGA